MEQTLGKRIMQHRKELKLTQDQLAEKLGVTAQAVSKWENDQSCPDISILPKLAAIFGISTDQLLGSEPEEKVHEGVVVTEDDKDEDNEKNHFRFQFDSGRAGAIGFAILVCAVGLQLLVAKILKIDISFWAVLWPTALFVFGFSGLLSHFSFFKLGSLLFGAYFLLDNWKLLPFQLGGDLVFPALIILFGLSLLADALKKPHKPKFHVIHNGDSKKPRHNFNIKDDSFDYSASFGEAVQFISLPCLSSGDISTSFGSYTVDLSGVEFVSENCHVEANCSFGELTLLVPAKFTVRPASATAFAEVSTSGQPDTDAQGIIHLEANASFASIEIRYI